MNVLRKRDVAARLLISARGLEEWVKKGKFPKPFNLGERVAVWDEADVDAWMQDKKSQGEANGTEGKAESLCTA